MEEEIKMAETVMLIDASFLNFVTEDIKKNFERMLNRELQEMDLSHLFTYLALDAGIVEGQNEIQIFFIYDKNSAQLVHENLLLLHALALHIFYYWHNYGSRLSSYLK